MNRRSSLSKAALITYGALFAAGGLWELPMVIDHHRHPRPAIFKDVNAIPGHLVVLGLVVVVLAVAWRIDRARLLDFLRRPWSGDGFREALLAPAFPIRSIAGIVGGVGRRSASMIAASPVVLLAWLMMVWSFVRSGEELVMNVDPATRVNAWGGPTWIGAVGAHWLDAAVVVFVAAWLLAWANRRAAR